MSFDWTFGRKLTLGFAVAGLTVLVIAVFGYQSTQHLIENDRLVSHTHQVRRDLSDLLSELKDAETGQRGYVITGVDSFLDPYRSAIGQIDATLDDVRQKTADNAKQQHRLDLLRPVIDAKLAELKRTVDDRRALGLEPVAKVIARGEGKQTMDEIRRIVTEMDEDEQLLLAQRSDEAESSSQTTKAVILWGSVLGTLFVVFIGTFIARSLTRQIGAAGQHIQSSSAELQSASSQQASGAKEQATAMREISTTISELLATSRQIAESAQRVALIADQTTGNARAGDSTVQKGNESMTGIRRQVDMIVSHMLELGKKSQQIGSVLGIVSELAEQTNILAINATIEAAGAGEAGRRFAVVADEIRKLADRVAGSTKEIRTLIDDVRGAVNTTIMTTETGSKAVDGGSKQFAEVALAFKQIAAQVTTANEAAKEIWLSTKQQATAVEQVNIAITNVLETSKETEASTTQTAQTASELTRLSMDLLSIVQPGIQLAARSHALA